MNKSESMMNSFGCYKYKQEENDEFLVYFGEFKNNERYGEGTMIYIDGSYYCGNWVGNKRSGNGKFYKTDKNIIQGNWVNDKLELKQCKVIKENGETYEGEINENY